MKFYKVVDREHLIFTSETNKARKGGAKYHTVLNLSTYNFFFTRVGSYLLSDKIEITREQFNKKILDTHSNRLRPFLAKKQSRKSAMLSKF